MKSAGNAIALKTALARDWKSPPGSTESSDDDRESDNGAQLDDITTKLM